MWVQFPDWPWNLTWGRSGTSKTTPQISQLTWKLCFQNHCRLIPTWEDLIYINIGRRTVQRRQPPTSYSWVPCLSICFGGQSSTCHTTVFVFHKVLCCLTLSWSMLSGCQHHRFAWQCKADGCRLVFRPSRKTFLGKSWVYIFWCIRLDSHYFPSSFSSLQFSACYTLSYRKTWH